MARPAPVHVNQFTARGRFPNGTTSTPYDCMVAAAVMDLDAATAGRIRLTTTQARARQDDQDTNGIGLDDVATIHKRTPGAPSLDYGRKGWPAVARRLESADGGIVTGYYITLGKHRASSFRGRHALYVQRTYGTRTGARVARINDPLSSGPRDIPLSALQAFYVSGAAGAGWSTGAGSSSGVSTPTPAPSLGAFADQIRFPVGHVITMADIDAIMSTLDAGGWWAKTGATFTAAAIARQTYRGILERVALGQPWTKALQDRLAADAGQAAGGAGDPFGVASGLQGAVAGLVGGFGEVARNGILLVGILALIIMGLWLVATAGTNRIGVLP